MDPFHSLKHSILFPLLDSVHPRGEGLPENLTEDLVVFAERFFTHFPKILQVMIYVVLGLLLLIAPLVALRRLAWLPSCTLQVKEEIFEKLLASRVMPLREIARLVKIVGTMGYYEQPAVMAAMGYDPDGWIAFAGERRLQLHGKDL